MEINGMNDTLNQWFASRMPEPGLLGFGVRLPDGNCASQIFSNNYLRDHFDETLRGLSETLPLFFQNGLAPRWLTWTFEQGQMRVALRPDGLLLCLAIQPNSPAAQNLDSFTHDFLVLDLTG
jgi:hypothetical protein